jgi:ribA/ribD-fused uncharacterized protein
MNNICIRSGCNRPQFQGHPYCGRTCANANANANAGTGVTTTNNICIRSGCNRPQFPGHPYCGRTCANASSNIVVPTVTNNNICIRPGCNRPQYPGHSYCGRTCANAGTGVTITNNICIRPGCNRPQFPGHPYCGKTCATSGITGIAATNNTLNRIEFYESNQPYYEFTNFYSQAIYDPKTGITFPTSEHYFQAYKFLGTNDAVFFQIAYSNTPREALDTARTYASYVRSDWHQGYKDQVMKDALLLKFTQLSNLRALLLETGNAILVEHTQNDNYWGDGGNGSGQNKLGQLLMEVRKVLGGQ